MAATPTTPSPFQLASAIEPAGELKFKAEIPAGWDQGKGAFGGLVLGLLARALQASEPDSKRGLRALIGDIAGPVLPGSVTIQSRILRRGNSQSNLAGELVQAGEVLCIGSAVLATARKAEIPEFPIETPEGIPPWSEVKVAPIRPPRGPPFGRFLEFRTIQGIPYSGASTPDVAGYVRLLGQTGSLDAAAIIALLDAHWPGTLAMATGPRATATVSFAGQIFCEPDSIDAEEPLFYRSRIVAKHTGYFLELRELWRGATCVGMNQQTLAMIR